MRLRRTSHEFQRGLLRWLKSDPAGLAEMKSAVAAIAATQDPDNAGNFWRNTIALLEALAQGGIAGDHEAKRLCARIEAQIRRLAHGSPDAASVDEQLSRDVLARIALAGPARAGGTILSKTIYELYLTEAHGHLDLLARELRLHAALPPSAEMISAAGTLAAISDTMGRSSVKALALALEGAMARISRLGAAPDDRAHELLQQTVAALREMAEAVALQQTIAAEIPLAAALDGLAPVQSQ